jgi:hypothetical protein
MRLISGFALFAYLKRHDLQSAVPVILLWVSDGPDDIQTALTTL